MSNNKEQLKKLRDYAELAMAAYGYFDRLKYNYAQDKDSKKALKEFRKIKDVQTATITYADILDITYKYYLDDNGKPKDGFFDDRLFDGEFAPLQAKRLFERYDLLIHQPNTESGFSATLFKEKTTKQYTLAIRGTELSLNQALKDVTTAESASIIKALYTYNVSLESNSVAR